MFSKELNKLTKADLEKLITDKISENQQLEYKRELPARNGKKETNSEKISDSLSSLSMFFGTSSAVLGS